MNTRRMTVNNDFIDGIVIKYDFETDGNNYRLTAKMAVLPTDRIDEWCKFQ